MSDEGLAQARRKMADAGVNLKFVYLATQGRVVIGADDMMTARTAMGS